MLRETQATIAASLVNSDLEAGAGAASHIHAGRLSAARRLEIYRHNFRTNLRGALKDIYPVIHAVVGDTFFMHAADQFVVAQPSRSGDLNQFGVEWAAFLGAYPYAADLPYLADVARLEWAWHRAFHAGDASALDLAALAAVPAEAHGALCLVLHPTTRLVKSSFPVLRIWEVNQPSFTGEMMVDWHAPADTLLLHRDVIDGVSVLIERVSPAGYAFLQALQREDTLEAASIAALAVDATFDLQGFLLAVVQSGVITGFTRLSP